MRWTCLQLSGLAEVRMTIAVATVLGAFLDDTSRPRYGSELMELTGFSSGKLYPVLARLQRAGWLTRTAEDVELTRVLGELDPTTAGRPPHRLYQLSPAGLQAARRAVGQAE